VRFFTASSIALAVVAMVACSSFATEGDPTPGAGEPDASRSDATNGSTTSSGGPPDATAIFECPSGVSFCDDFERADASDVKGAWTSLQTATNDPPAKIENGAFHLFSATVDAEGQTARTYLFRDLPDCTAAKVSIDLDFMLEGPRRTANLSVITIEAAAATYYISLAVAGANIELAVGKTGTAHVLEGTTGAPALGAWTHAQYVVDVSAATVAGQIGAVPFGVKQIDAMADIKSCRFAIGDDYIEPGDATSRWYDNVVARVER
jgi:hypothetical protein